MSEISELLRGTVPLFAEMPDSELETLAGLCSVHEFPQGDPVTPSGEPAKNVYLLVDGAVEVWVETPDGSRELAVTGRAGNVLGLSSIGGEASEGLSYLVIEPAKAVVLPASRVSELLAADPGAAEKLLRFLLAQALWGARLATDRYRAALGWSRQISGASHLSFGTLVDSASDVVLELLGGGEARGSLVQVTGDPGAQQLMLQTASGDFEIVPYHAVKRVRIDARTSAAVRAVVEGEAEDA